MFAKVAAHNPTFYADIAEPQSLNKYQYALNNPLRNIDPDGHQSTLSDRVSSGASGTVAGGASGSVSRRERIKNVAVSVGRTLQATVNGAASTMGEDNGIGGTDGEQNTAGRGIGHALALVQAAGEIYAGTEATVAGGTEAIVTSPGVVTVVGTAAPLVGAAVVVGGVVTAAHGILVGANTLGNIFSKGGKLNKKDSGLADKTDEQIREGAKDKSLDSAERKKYQTEEKARGDRNKQKRKSQ